MSTIKSENISHLDNTGTPNISLSSDGSTKIVRPTIDDSQVQSFVVTNENTANWYPFNPIPAWCHHVRYDIYTGLSTRSEDNHGFYLRWGNATTSILGTDITPGVTEVSVLSTAGIEVTSKDPLFIRGSTNGQIFYRYVFDLYINQSHNSSDLIYSGIGSGSMFGASATAEISSSVLKPLSHANATTAPDRLGVLLFGGTAANNFCQVKQTFMTDGLPDTYGPTPTAI